MCLLQASRAEKSVATTESQLRSKANILFSQWTSYFGPFDGPGLLTRIVHQANKSLHRKQIQLISAFISTLLRSIFNLVVSGNDGFIVSEIHLREFPQVGNQSSGALRYTRLKISSSIRLRFPRSSSTRNIARLIPLPSLSSLRQAWIGLIKVGKACQRLSRDSA